MPVSLITGEKNKWKIFKVTSFSGRNKPQIFHCTFVSSIDVIYSQIEFYPIIRSVLRLNRTFPTLYNTDNAPKLLKDEILFLQNAHRKSLSVVEGFLSVWTASILKAWHITTRSPREQHWYFAVQQCSSDILKWNHLWFEIVILKSIINAFVSFSYLFHLEFIWAFLNRIKI